VSTVPVRFDQSFVHDGSRLVYDVYGTGDRVVIYTHGLLLDSQLNRGIAEALAEHGNRVVLLDLLGHGRSDQPHHATQYRIDRYADQIVGLMDHLGVDRAVLAGLSLGANASLFAAARYPERVRALVLEMPVLGEEQRTEIRTEIMLTRALALRSFTASLHGSGMRFDAEGRVEGDTVLELTLVGEESREVRRIPLTEPIVLPQLLPLRLAFGGELAVGRSYSLRLFDPVLLETRDATATGEGSIDFARETIDLLIRPSPKHSLVELATPFAITGSLADPSVQASATGATARALGRVVAGPVNFLGSLLSFIDDHGRDRNNPCLSFFPTEAGTP